MFDRAAFESGFDGRLKKLANAEKITKETLRDMSRELLFITQESEDIGYVNRVVVVLAPVNKKVAILFFKEFSGFVWNEDEQKFSRKDKKKYEQIAAIATKQLEDPHFNMWTWADRELSIEAKPFDLAKVTTFAAQAIKKAERDGISKGDILKAFIAGGFDADMLLAVMESMTQA